MDGYNIVTDTQRYRRSVTNKILMPLFFVSIPKMQEVAIDKIFSVTEYFGIQIIFEAAPRKLQIKNKGIR